MKFIKSLKGHTSAINGICFGDQQNSKIWSASSDQNAKLWDLKSKKCTYTFQPHQEAVTCIQLHPNNSMKLITASLDKICKVWDISSSKNRMISSLTHTSGIRSIFCTDHTIFAGAQDGTIKVFDTRMQKCTHTLSEHTDEISCLYFDQSKNVVISASFDKTIKEWDFSTGKVSRTWTGHTSHITSFSIDSNKIISTSKDNSIKIWSRYHNEMKTMSFPTSVFSLKHESDQLYVATSNELKLFQPQPQKI